MKIRHLVPVCLCAFLPALSFGQQNGITADRERERQKDTVFEQKATTDESRDADEDLGRLRKATAPSQTKEFTFSSATRLEYDSNALLSSTAARDSMITVESIKLRYEHQLAPQLKLDTSVRQQFFWFENSTASDFMGQSGGVDLSYQVAKGPRISFGPSLYRFENMNQGNQTVQGVDLHLGVDHATPFFDGKSALFYGYQAVVEATDPSVFDRYQQQAFLGWNQTIIPKVLTAQTFYRFAYSDYLTVTREDQNHMTGASLIYRLNEYVSVTGFCNYTWNVSTASIAQYRNLATGATLNLSFRF